MASPAPPPSRIRFTKITNFELGSTFGGAATPGVTPFGTPTMANAGVATAFGKPAAAPGQQVFGAAPSTSLFGSAATGTPGAATGPQGGSLFGGTGTATTFGLGQTGQSAFGFSSATATPNIFGATPGAGAPGTGGLFGASTSTAPTQVSTSNAVVPFGAPAKPTTGFGTLGAFGQTAATPQQTGGLFGNTSGGMFSAGFGAAPGATAVAGTPVKFSPLVGTDNMVKNGVQQTINTRHQCITCMKEYESKSLEELRMEDYAAGRRGAGAAASVPGATNSMVTPGFGATGNVFGANTGSTTAGSLFGNPATGTTAGVFSSATTSANSGFSFSVPGSNLFGASNASKPFGATPQPSALFGSGSTTNAFGTQSMGFTGFGQQNQSIGLFGQNKSPFGNTGTAALSFGAGTSANPAGAAQPAQGTNIFGAKPATATNTFGSPGGFGTSTSTAPPAFGNAFGTSATGTSGGTGLNLGQPSLFGNTAAKPAGTGMFGTGTTGTTGSLFVGTSTAPGLGGTNTFGAGNTSLGLVTGGSSIFGSGNTMSGLGTLGSGNQLGQGMLGANTGTGLLGSGSTLGTGTNTLQWPSGSGGLGLSLGNQSGTGLMGYSGNTSLLGNTQLGGGGLGGTGSMGLGAVGSGAGVASGTGGGAQHVMAVSSLPFGDSRLFRDLLPSSSKLDDVLKTTNPAAQKALMAGSQFKVSPHSGNSGSKVKVKPLGASALSKRSLFDGLEEEDASLLTVFSPRTGSKRLTLKPKTPGASNTDSSVNVGDRSTNSTPTAGPSNGPSLSLRARLAGSSAIWDKDSPRQNAECSTWLHKSNSNSKEPSKTGSFSQLQNSTNHESPNVILANESALDLENTMTDLRTRIDSSGSTPVGRPPHRKKDIESPPDGRSKHSLDPGDDVGDEVDSEVSLTLELGNSPDKGIEDLRREDDDELEPHPTGIVLRRTGYYTIPSLDELATMVEEVEGDDGEKKVSVIVENFTVGREGYGNVFFPESFDVGGLNLDEIVHFRHKEIVVYPGDEEEEGQDGTSSSGPRGLSSKPTSSRKPPVGSGLNRKAQVTLDRVWPVDKVTRTPVTDPDRLAAMNYEEKLQRVCAQMRTRFVEYRPQTGSWVFKVDHFSKYGLSDSDDDELPPLLPMPGTGPGSTATVGPTTGVAPGANAVVNGTNNKKVKRIPLHPQENGILGHPRDEQMDSMAEESAVDSNRGNGWSPDGASGKRFQSLNAGKEVYENGFHDGGIRPSVALSPTAQMAQQLGTSTHKVQLMKASFFADEGDDIDAELVEKRPFQPLLAKSRESVDKSEENSGPKPAGDLFRTRFSCRDPTILSRNQSERGFGKETSHGLFPKPSGPPSTVSSSSASPFLLPLQETPPPQSVPIPLVSKASSTSSRPSLFPPHPLVHRSKIAVLRHRGRHLKRSDLVQTLLPSLDNQSLLLADLGLFIGRKFRSGWGPGMKLSAITSAKVAADSMSVERKLFSPLVPLSNGRNSSDYSGVVVQQLHLLGGTRNSRIFETWIEPHLWVQLQHSVISDDDDSFSKNKSNESSEDLEPDLNVPCPRFLPRPGKDIIHAHHELAHSEEGDDIDPEYPEYHLSSYSRLVWDLCCALWGRLPELEDDLEEEKISNSHKVTMARRRALSEWLQQAADQLARGKGRKGGAGEMGDDAHTKIIFNLLTRRRLLEACEAAQKKGDHFLALLLSGGNWNCRAQLRKQLGAWSRVGADDFISDGRMKLMSLKAGTLLLPTTSVQHGTIDCCRGLDWKRAFALHLWYVCSPICSITDALKEYESACIDEQKNFDDNEDKDSSDRASLYAPPPAPHYLEAEQICQKMEIGGSGKLPYYDLCFHMLKLYSCRSHSLEALLNTATHTPDPLDVRLSWLLCVSLNALGYTHLSAEALASLHQGMAALLESHGLWHWALFPLLHLENPKRRKACVLSMLSRHVRLPGSDMLPEEEEIYVQRESFVINHLRIPSSWVYHAKANLAAALHRHGDTAWCLAKAGLWNECHKVILKHIAADAVINENLDYLRELLAQLAPEERSQTISGWASGGQVFWDYLEVLSEIETMMNRREKSIQSELDCTNEGYCLERLQPKLSSLCSRLITLPCNSAKESKGSVETPSASRVLAYLVTQLPMPPDYLMQELRHLVEVHLDQVTDNDEDLEKSYVMT
ncbi:hypothetical protein J437_LFUL010864 [Ladona fulva]|uniref:Nuclear pore complex protein Nup98-Nup96 n=1 Tax=Ladona fulva TaxID=123851 RepID=A0A8K0K891_LADFU|nr:hypothetical protein J437_LFUL010864 [Ladona fulva]